MIPWCYGYDNRVVNFVASCHICNAIKTDKIFDTPEQARGYIIERREKKGWPDHSEEGVLLLQDALPTEPASQNLLLG